MDIDESIEEHKIDIRGKAVLGPCEVDSYKPDYAYSTIEEYENIVGYRVNDAFRNGWDMARTTNKQLKELSGL